ncbi:lycopene cyclase domain-containing protein [Sinomicrobium sp. M5D2P9]
MDQYIYLFISVFLCVPWIIFFRSRPDLRRKIWKASVIGGFAGLIAEFWYFRDYWHPPSSVGSATVSPEDFLFGFFVTGLAVSVYDVVFRKTTSNGEQRRKKHFAFLFLTGVGALFLFNNLLGFHSIFVSSVSFIIFSIIMVIVRKDLWRPLLASGILILLLIIPIYAIIFNLMSPTYWDSYGLLSGTPYGATILGNIPLTELLWYFSWGCMAGIAYDFASGKKKTALFRSEK